MEPHESQELIERAEEHHPFKKLTALIISIMAMVLAINHVGGSNASKEVTRHNIEASNYYAFYQAKSIKQTQAKIAVDFLQMDLNLPNKAKLSPPEVALIAHKLTEYQESIIRYESDEQSGEGKTQLLEKAKEHEAERNHALKQDPWFDYAEGVLQIGIVLLSISILAELPVLLFLGGGLGLIGLGLTLNGFFLVF